MNEIIKIWNESFNPGATDSILFRDWHTYRYGTFISVRLSVKRAR